MGGRPDKQGSASAADLLAAALASSQHFAASTLGQTPADIFGDCNWGSLPDVKAAESEAILKYASDTSANPQHLRVIRQCFALITKNTAAGAAASDDERRRKCFSKFVATQRANRRTKKRLLHFLLKHPLRMRPQLGALLGRAQLELFWLLGPAPSSEDWDHFVRAKVFSSGVVQGLARLPGGLVKDTSGYGKMAYDTELTSTRACLRRFGAYLFDGPYGTHVVSGPQPEHNFRVTESSEGTTVYKDAGIDRFIATEPLCNAMAQQGLAAILEKYLRKWGVILSTQERNQMLARIASRLGFHPNGFATIDLSAASDTIVDELVRYLLPPGWYELLNAARTTSVTLDKEPIDGYASFVTMGNATTFPLQCLIFTALTRAAISLSHCDDRRYRVYGDDIIVPLSASAILIEALNFCGFKVNQEKSFITGFFRESCGGDYLLGEDVRPVFLRESLNHMSTRHVFFNNLQRVFPEHPVLKLLFTSVKRPLIGPARDGDSPSAGYFECPTWLLHERRYAWYSKKLHAWQYRIRELRPIPVKYYRLDETRAYLAALAGESNKETTITKPPSPGLDDPDGEVRWSSLRDTVTWHVRETTIGWLEF